MRTFPMLLALFTLSGCSPLGTRPSADLKETFKSSKQYNAQKGEFDNRIPDLSKAMKKRSMTWKVFKEWYSSGTDRVPKEKLPDVRPDIAAFLAESSELKVIWFGHSTFLLNMGGKIILVDPVFSGSASPVSFMVKRFQKPVLDLAELPAIDILLLSHDHYDHLDMETIKFFADKKITFIAPLGVGSHLRGWGVPDGNIVEKDWWESEKIGDITFTATPAQHFSGRDGFHENGTLWASWAIKSNNHNIYFSGDSGYDTHFKEIGDRLGPFDVAFLESGQYNEAWKEVHMLPEEAVVAFKELGAKTYFPVHWGMFELALHSWYEPIEKLFKYSKEQEFQLIAPRLGEIVDFSQAYQIVSWWDTVAKTEILASAAIQNTEAAEDEESNEPLKAVVP